MKLALVEPAARDLDSIISYIALDNLAAAEKVFSVFGMVRSPNLFMTLGRPSL